HRRLKFQMGSLHEQLHCTQKMELPGTMTAHQSVGIENNSVCFSFFQGNNRPENSSQNRQYDLCSIYQPSGWNSITQPVQDRRESLNIMLEQESTVKSKTCTRSTEHISGQGIMYEERQK